MSSSGFGTLTFLFCSLFWIKMTYFLSDDFIWAKALHLFKVQIKEPCAHVTSCTELGFYFYKKSSENFTWISADLSIAINNRRLCSSVCMIDVLRGYNMVAFCFRFFVQVGMFMVWKGMKKGWKEKEAPVRCQICVLIANAAVRINYMFTEWEKHQCSSDTAQNWWCFCEIFFFCHSADGKQNECAKWTNEQGQVVLLTSTELTQRGQREKNIL